MEELNPQRAQMADDSMVRNLAAQAEAIWPQEADFLNGYGIPADARILDAGCGTGEATRRLADLFPSSSVLGVDVLESHLDRGRALSTHFGSRVRFENRSIFTLGLPARSFDLVVCRHVLQSIPRADDAVAELVRVTRRGGRLHLIAEDYGMVHFPKRRRDTRGFWPTLPARFGAAGGTDMLIGRRAPAILKALGLADIRLAVVVVDTLRVPRQTFAAIWQAWKDGFVDAIAERCGIAPALVADHFDDQLDTIRDPGSYAAWMVPVVSGVVV